MFTALNFLKELTDFSLDRHCLHMEIQLQYTITITLALTQYEIHTCMFNKLQHLVVRHDPKTTSLVKDGSYY
jgi:hypothetical protein